MPTPLEEVWSRFQPAGDLPLDQTLAIAAGLAAVLLVVPGLWRWAGIGVTVVHELGHAVVGVAAGRRFTGLVLRPDMSGHTVTVGPTRGLGLIASTWAGYPAPAVAGAATAQLALAGWSPAILGVVSIVLLVALARARSPYTVAVLVGLAGLLGSLWWWAPAGLQGMVVFATGCFLAGGAWRHLAAVVARPGLDSDPSLLARLTHVPRIVWLASHAAAIGVATWWLAGGLRLG